MTLEGHQPTLDCHQSTPKLTVPEAARDIVARPKPLRKMYHFLPWPVHFLSLTHTTSRLGIEFTVAKGRSIENEKLRIFPTAPVSCAPSYGTRDISWMAREIIYTHHAANNAEKNCIGRCGRKQTRLNMLKVIKFETRDSI
jgi:hypothetical protein